MAPAGQNFDGVRRRQVVKPLLCFIRSLLQKCLQSVTTIIATFLYFRANLHHGGGGGRRARKSVILIVVEKAGNFRPHTEPAETVLSQTTANIAHPLLTFPSLVQGLPTCARKTRRRRWNVGVAAAAIKTLDCCRNLIASTLIPWAWAVMRPPKY